MKTWMCALSLLLVVAFAAPAQSANTANASSQDRNWLVAAHQVNLAEIQSGKLAEQVSHSDAVKKAARMMVSDHEALDAKLKPLARQLGVDLPDQPNQEQRQDMQQFKQLSGANFNRTWSQKEAAGHEKAIAATQQEIRDGKSSQVKQLAQSALPHLQDHLRALRDAEHATSATH